MELKIQPLMDVMGAVVHGWQPEEALSESDRGKILGALRQYLVLVFRGQSTPTEPELVRFAGSFGELVKGTEWLGDITHYPEILPVTNVVDESGVPKGTAGRIELPWHSDYSYCERVGKESFLEALTLPSDAPRTYFCSQYLALETLPAKTVDRLRGLHGFHDVVNYDVLEIEDAAHEEVRVGLAAKAERDKRLGIDRAPYPVAVHPIIKAHPETGREALYVSPLATRRIVDMPEDESKDLLEELFSHSLRPETVFGHDWEEGDLVMFDTFGTMHARDSWESGEPRIMRQLSTMTA